MQIENIQRPALFSDFFGLELMWNNEYLTYIQITIGAVTSSTHNITINHKNIIKKNLKQINTFYLIFNKSFILRAMRHPLKKANLPSFSHF